MCVTLNAAKFYLETFDVSLKYKSHCIVVAVFAHRHVWLSF